MDGASTLDARSASSVSVTNMRAALKHLKKSDQVMAAIIERVGPFTLEYREPVFETLVRSIVFQQLSGRVASVIFARLHATQAYPIVSLLFLGSIAAIFCWLPLRQVLQAILSIRAIIPFMAQIAGAVILRVRQPDRRRPFRMWLYPLPAIVALGLWSYIVISPQKGLKVGGLYVIAAGTLFYFIRRWLEQRAKNA